MARTRIKVGVIPKFPAQVVGENGISIDQTGGVFTFSIDPDTASDVLGLEIGVDVQAYDDDLQAVSALSGTGIAVRTTSGTWALRTITGTANEVTVTSGDGASTSPIISLSTALTFTGKTVTGGTFSNVGDITSIGTIIAGGSSNIRWASSTVLQAPADGVLALLNNAGSGFSRLQLGGTSASFPSIKRNATALNFRLADDSADAPITAGATTLSGSLTYGGVTLSNSVTGTGSMALSAGPTFTGTLGAADILASSHITAGGASNIRWGSSTVMNAPADGRLLLRDNAGTTFGRLQLGGTTSSFPAIKRNGAALNFRLADDSADAAITAGDTTLTGTLTAGNASNIRWASSSVLQAPSDGVVVLLNSAGSSFSRLQFGGTTSSFPSIKRNSAALNFRLADDSADAAVTHGAVTMSGALTYGGVTLANAVTGTGNMVLSAGPTFTGTVNAADITASGGLSAGGSSNIRWTSSTVMSAPADGRLLLTDNAGTAFSRLQLGGTTSSFPSIKRNATALNFRLADDSGDAPITAGATTLSGALTYGGVTLTNNVTGTGKMVLDNTPTLITPALGAATATSINSNGFLAIGAGTANPGTLGSNIAVFDMSASQMRMFFYSSSVGPGGGFLVHSMDSAGNAISHPIEVTTATIPALLLTKDGGDTVIGGTTTTASRNSGFVYIPTAAGTPSGTPTSYSGRVAMLYDTSANKLWVYNGSWRSVTLA